MDAPKLSPYRWAVLACVCGVCFMANYMQYQVSVWGVVVMETLGIQVGELQTLMLMPMLAAVFLAIPAGTLADRFGVKRVVDAGLTVAVVAGFARAAFLDSFAIQIATMFGLGFGISTLNANMPKILGIWFKHKMTVAVGIFYAVSCVAIVMAQSVSTLFPDLFATYIVAAFALLAVCVCWYLFVRNHPAGEALPEPEPVTKYLGTAAKSKNVWFIALVYGLTLASTTGFSTIFPAMMEIVRGYDMTLSGNLAAVGTIGSFFACFVGPAWVQKSGKKQAIPDCHHRSWRHHHGGCLVDSDGSLAVGNPHRERILDCMQRPHHRGHDLPASRDRREVRRQRGWYRYYDWSGYVLAFAHRGDVRSRRELHGYGYRLCRPVLAQPAVHRSFAGDWLEGEDGRRRR